MLRQRHPVNQFISGPSGPGGSMGGQSQPAAYQQMQRQFARQPLRQQHPAAMQNNQMFQQSYGNMQPGMNQSYGGYGGQQMMQSGQPMMQSNQGMMQPNQQNMMQSFGGQQQNFVGQQQNMMGQRAPQTTDYMTQQRAMGQNRPQYMQVRFE